MIDMERDPRIVASEWHGGQWTALYSFASSGFIRSDLSCEIERCQRELAAHPERHEDPAQLADELAELLAYVTQPVTSVWSAYGHVFSSDGDYATCDRCGGEWQIQRDRDDPSSGRYVASNGDDATECTGDTSMEHGHPGETGHSLDCESGCEHCQHTCNCVLCA
jgi:hypothetical protein